MIDSVAVMPGEMTECSAWFDAKFRNTSLPNHRPPHLQELANQWGPVKQNRNALGRALNIAGREYARGLSCHAVSRVAVRLAAPGRRFAAVVGVDSNPEWTIPGKGNVVFTVRVRGKEVFRSPVLCEGRGGVPVDVSLGGASEFLLEVNHGGGGIDYGQGDWAEARVTLADGAELWLGEIVCSREGLKAPPSVGWPFSFSYGGRPWAELLDGWSCERRECRLDACRTEHTLLWTDPDTRLQVRCVAVRYDDFPTVEWTVYLKNAGETDTPIVEHLFALDALFEREPGCEFLLRHAVGSPATPGDYGPLQTPLGRSVAQRIATSGGRGSDRSWPYFNLEAGREGVIVAVGWPGQWAAEFARNDGNGVRVTAGQETTRFKLLPGEEVRTPLMAVQFWKGGDWVRAQNVWRRWMKAHSMPRPGGELPAPRLFGCTSRLYEEMAKANEENQIACLDRYRAEGLPLDSWWIDAGWYPIRGNWTTTGTWEVDRTRFPRGLKAISDHAHQHGLKLMVWFEPERVTRDTWLSKHHPEWLLGGTLLNLGNSEAWSWLVNHVDRLLTEEGIDLYRQDFNIEPLPFWQANDTPDRQGITENKHVCGYLAYWDELRRRHPDLLIDACASGGRRNDLETMRRAVPLWRSDCAYDPVATQSQTYGLSLWLPYYGTGTVAAGVVPTQGAGWTPVEPYAFWSNAAPSLALTMDIRETGLDYDLLRRLAAQWRDLSRCYYGDFHPLTSYTLRTDLWVAWQFHDAGRNTGMVQCFRRPESPYVAARLKLQNLDPDALYRLEELTADRLSQARGRDLMENGWDVTLVDAPSVAVLRYGRVDS